MIQDNKFWGIRRGGQSTNRFSIGNRTVSWKWIRVMSGYFVRPRTIIMGMGGVFKYGITQSTGNRLLKHLKTVL